MKYEIQCGVIDEVVEAKNHEVAFKALVRKYQPKSLALLMRFRELDEFNRPLKSKGSDLGKWKYQNPLSILNSIDTREAGKKGGLATKKKYGVKHFKRIRKLKESANFPEKNGISLSIIRKVEAEAEERGRMKAVVPEVADKIKKQARHELIEEIEKILPEWTKKLSTAHYLDVIVRRDGKDEKYEGDWIKNLVAKLKKQK